MLENKKQKYIVTVGMFDGLHLGHQHILDVLKEEAATRGLEPMVITFDKHPRQVLEPAVMAPLLLTSNAERIELIRQYGINQIEILPFTQSLADMTACQFFVKHLVNQLHIAALVLGYDNTFGNKQSNDFEQLEPLAVEYGVDVVHANPIMYEELAISSSRIRKALQSGNLQGTNNMLGRPYSLTGLVVQGRHWGRTLNFPTANILISESLKALPIEGVYAVTTQILGREELFKGMANIGPLPTYNIQDVHCEVHLIDFNDDIYGKELRIELHEKIRDIQKFESTELLKLQLELDCEKCQKILNH